MSKVKAQRRQQPGPFDPTVGGFGTRGMAPTPPMPQMPQPARPYTPSGSIGSVGATQQPAYNGAVQPAAPPPPSPMMSAINNIRQPPTPATPPSLMTAVNSMRTAVQPSTSYMGGVGPNPPTPTGPNPDEMAAQLERVRKPPMMSYGGFGR